MQSGRLNGYEKCYNGSNNDKWGFAILYFNFMAFQAAIMLILPMTDSVPSKFSPILDQLKGANRVQGSQSYTTGNFMTT